MIASLADQIEGPAADRQADASVITAIEVRNLSFTYHDGRQALDKVSFRVQKGESVALIGPNGAGKSTLLEHLNGLLPEELGDAAAVFVFGQPVIAENLAQIRCRVGLLFQDSEDQLFCPTVFEDVAFGPQQFGLSKESLDCIVQESLAMAGLHGFESRPCHHLSDGEKQRVCLAGLLACRPDILALDEPTRGLDPRGKRRLTALLQKLPLTKIIATHDLELVVQLCSRVILFDAGRIVKDASALDVLADEELMLEHGLERPHSLTHYHLHLMNDFYKIRGLNY
ncbi:MAG: energy-coupling factor ABC transporter ATP-binding protein [Elusimicrobia bacterium]|nr:energy-coupling factor ABC transporter ATP-binding protein [Elusimicrobiota bacterium]